PHCFFLQRSLSSDYRTSALGKRSVFSAFVGSGNNRSKLMRTSTLAVIAFGTMIAVPAMAQQQSGAQQQTGPDQQMQDDADKGVKTRDSGASGYVADQEKPGASSHPPGQPHSSSDQKTTGSSSGTSSGR